METPDKIRILWIHDTDDEPGITLPDEYDRYFTIVTKLPDGKAYFIDSMDMFRRILERFWFDKDDKALPVELMAVDYDLSKRRSNRLERDASAHSREDYIEAEENDQVQTGDLAAPGESLDFDGLLLGLFYASLTYRHPVAFVPTTHRYTDLSRITTSVPELQKLSMRILGIHFDYVNKNRPRTWQNIIEAGVSTLRNRMKVLCERHWCVFDLGDLKALIQNPHHETLRLYSPYAIRRLPVQGLFIDKSDQQERLQCIQEWSKSMIEQLSSYDELKEAEQFAEDLWNLYDDDALVMKREELSRRLADDSGAELPQEIQDMFAPMTSSRKQRCMKGCFDIRSGKHPDSVRRQAALEIIMKLLKRCIQARKAVEQMTPAEIRENNAMLAPDRPVVNAEDVYLALFPVPESPLVFHWHTGKKADASHGWVSSLMDWSAGQGNERRRGDLALRVQDVLDGKEWNPTAGTYGLLPSERHILRCKALADEDLSVDDWKSHFVANRILRWEEIAR